MLPIVLALLTCFFALMYRQRVVDFALPQRGTATRLALISAAVFVICGLLYLVLDLTR